jgi:hypothetical protein
LSSLSTRWRWISCSRRGFMEEGNSNIRRGMRRLGPALSSWVGLSDGGLRSLSAAAEGRVDLLDMDVETEHKDTPRGACPGRTRDPGVSYRGSDG